MVAEAELSFAIHEPCRAEKAEVLADRDEQTAA
jgi:hypothetical protein